MKDQFPFSQVVAVDVAKTTLDFAFADSNQTLSIDNDSDQIVSQLIGGIKNPQTTMVVMEATGGNEELLVTLLHRRKHATRRG